MTILKMINSSLYFKLVCFYILFSTIISLSYSQEITIKNGVKFINNEVSPKKDIQNIELQFIRKYGGLDATTEDMILYHQMSVALDNNNNLYILDLHEPNIKVYNSEGSFIRNFGKKGQGPVEFSRPIGIDIDSENNIYISDFLTHSISKLSTEGKHIRTIHPKVKNSFPIFRVLNNHFLISGTDSFPIRLPEGSIYNEPVIKMYDQNGNFIKNFGEIGVFEDQSVCKMGNAVCLSIDKNDNIYVAYRFQNRIEKYNYQGTLLLQIKRRLPYKFSEKAKLIIERRKNGIISGVGSPILNIFSFGISTDYKERIWTLTFSRQPKRRFYTILEDEKNYVKLEIFDKEGFFVKDILLSEAFETERNCIYIRKNRLFLINSIDVSVSEYRIIN